MSPAAARPISAVWVVLCVASAVARFAQGAIMARRGGPRIPRFAYLFALANPPARPARGGFGPRPRDRTPTPETDTL